MPVAGLAHDQVPVSVCRDLRQVGDDDDLGVLGQRGQPGPDVEGRGTAHPGVDLVEDEGGHVHRPAGAGHDLEGEHDAGQLTTGGGLGDGAGRAARVGGEQDLDVVGAVPTRTGRRVA